MASIDTDHLHDQLDLLAAVLELQWRGATGAHDEAAYAHLAAVIGTLEGKLADQRTAQPELAVSALVTALGLSPSELDVIWFLAAIQLRPQLRALVARASGSTATDPSLGTIQTLVYGHRRSLAALQELAPEATLRRLGVIERTEAVGRDTPDNASSWALSRRVLRWLHGDRTPDAAVTELSRSLRPCASDLETTPEALRQAREAMRAPRAIVMACGSPGTGRRSLLMTAARDAGMDLVVADLARCSPDLPVFRAQLRALALECRLLGGTPLLCNLDALVDERGERLAVVVNELATLVTGKLLVTCRAQKLTTTWDRPSIRIELGRLTSAQRTTLWHRALGEGTLDDATLLANQYPLAPALIHHAGEAVRARAVGRPIVPDDIYEGIRAVLDDRLGQYATRIAVTQRWEDAVLPDEHVEALVELMSRVRRRDQVYEGWGFADKVGKGIGVSALFSGPPGTGKTMVAALIAQDLGLELYQVDMAKIVSKYIGETEKNLGALFDAAEAGHAVLLFDEADALFGKRTDVKSSNDRYANLETNYLLQRLETFTGICLLTSNHDSHIDPAFERRLSLRLRFELPDVEERAKLWRAVLPADAPIAAGIDFEGLARRFVMSGGYIRNAVLRAAFAAADLEQPITHQHLDRAARVEYEGMGKIAA